MAQVAEGLASMCEALDSVPSGQNNHHNNYTLCPLSSHLSMLSGEFFDCIDICRLVSF
jgi:hypothetical protein